MSNPDDHGALMITSSFVPFVETFVPFVIPAQFRRAFVPFSYCSGITTRPPPRTSLPAIAGRARPATVTTTLSTVDGTMIW
jgi:hypothetical protein